ncbi:transposase [Luteolibacter sp. AS25]|uniref:transposase n=1 Tax=Luteolibacter sp. AS25 TaxID=3135776 RepID=UPI00398B893C
MMPRALRHQYPGAVYHIMARGDGGKTIFETDDDRKLFLYRLGKVCESHGWKVHAWVLMGNHFHLLLETPEPNLVGGMKGLLGPYSQAWNRQRMRRGHVFQGRYKSVPVSAVVDSPYYFRILADYIHLNPSRAGLAGGKHGKLLSYRWSSLPDYHRGGGPDWLVRNRLLEAFQLAKDGRGRKAYVEWLEKRAEEDGEGIPDEAMKALRRGWYLGEPSFVDKLTQLVKPEKKKIGMDPVGRMHDELEAERILMEASGFLGLPARVSELAGLRKGDARKVLIASFLKQRTSVSNTWLSKNLAMGHTASISRLVGDFSRSKAGAKKIRELEKMLKCST